MTADPRPVLAIEASTALVSCSVHAEFDVDVSTLATARQVEVFPEIVERALAAARVSLPELRLVVVGAGPGSYTGLRTALAFGNGLSHAIGCPIAGVGTLDSIAMEVVREGRIAIVALEAGRDRVSAAAYRLGAGGTIERHLDPCSMSHSEFERYAATRPEPAEVHRPPAPPTARNHVRVALLRPDWLSCAAPGAATPQYNLPPAGAVTIPGA